MIYRIRIILDVEEDVFRDIEIESSATLEDLHHYISQSFGFLGNEMASFYKSDENWKQGEELPLESMEEGPNMRNKHLNSIFSPSINHLIYIYDFLNLWTFFVELKEVGEIISGIIYPNLIHSKGEVPEQPPEKIFEGENSETHDEEKGEENFESDYEDSALY